MLALSRSKEACGTQIFSKISICAYLKACCSTRIEGKKRKFSYTKQTVLFFCETSVLSSMFKNRHAGLLILCYSVQETY